MKQINTIQDFKEAVKPLFDAFPKAMIITCDLVGPDLWDDCDDLQFSTVKDSYGEWDRDDTNMYEYEPIGRYFLGWDINPELEFSKAIVRRGDYE